MTAIQQKLVMRITKLNGDKEYLEYDQNAIIISTEK